MQMKLTLILIALTAQAATLHVSPAAPTRPPVAGKHPARID